MGSITCSLNSAGRKFPDAKSAAPASEPPVKRFGGKPLGILRSISALQCLILSDAAVGCDMIGIYASFVFLTIGAVTAVLNAQR